MDKEVTPPFARTTCGCADCVQCCKDQPGPLAPGDLERVAQFFGVRVQDVEMLFVRSPGAVVWSASAGKRRIETIVPAYRDGRCVFLTAQDRCGIHAAAPFGCSHFDTHMSAEEARPRSVWLVTAIDADADYKAQRDRLVPATHYQPRSY